MTKTIAIGEMKHKITLQSVTQSDDGYGGKTEGTPTTKRDFWVKAEQVKSARNEDGSQQVLSNTWRFTGWERMSKHAANGDLLTFNNQQMQVLSVATDFVFTEIIAEVRNG